MMPHFSRLTRGKFLRQCGLHALVFLSLLSCVRLFLVFTVGADSYVSSPGWAGLIFFDGLLQDSVLVGWILVGFLVMLAVSAVATSGLIDRLVFFLYSAVLAGVFVLVSIDAGYVALTRAHLHLYALQYASSIRFFYDSFASAATRPAVFGVSSGLLLFALASWRIGRRLVVSAAFPARAAYALVAVLVSFGFGAAASRVRITDTDAEVFSRNVIVHVLGSLDRYQCRGGVLAERARDYSIAEASASVRSRAAQSGRIVYVDDGFPFLKTTLENACVLGIRSGSECERDADRDGFQVGVDCNDADPATHPGAVDVAANQRDENCDGGDAARPNIILVVLESFGAQFSSAFGGPDSSLTPTLNALAGSGLTIQDFYSNGTDTDSSLLSLLCSAHPTLTGVPPSTDPNLKLNCLPEILSGFGYRTFAMQSGTLDFLDKRTFFPRIGFGEALGKDELGGLGVPGWGITDRQLFTQVSRKLDSLGDAPFFLTLYTVATHHPWQLPADGQALYPENDFASRFKNLVHYTDAALGEFLERNANEPWMRNTILVVTADNGQPLGDQHAANRVNYLHVYDENVRVPLVIAGPGVPVGPRPIIGSHVDVAPTLLHLLGIETLESFVGTSLLDPTRTFERSVAYVSSPFDSCVLGVRQGQDKFITDIALRRKFLYTVVTDPTEQQNLAAERPERASELEQLATAHFLDATAVGSANRLWADHWSALVRQLQANRTHETFHRTSGLQ